MRLNLFVFALGMSLLSTVQAAQLEACQQEVQGDVCQHYLEGVIDGALMYKPNATGVRVEGSGYEARALKYRSGKRFEEANRTYCEGRIPDRLVLLTGLTEAFSAGDIQNIEELNNLMYSLLSCQRLK